VFKAGLGCIEAHIRKPRTEEDAKFAEHERDCPLCRQTISISKLFARNAFEPTDEELNISGDVEGFNIDWEVDTSTGEGRYKAQTTGKRKARKRQADTFSDLEDFIVDDDDTAERGLYRRARGRKSTSKARNIISDDKEKLNGVIVISDDSDDLGDIELIVKKAKNKRKLKSRRKVIDSDSDIEAVSPKRPRVDAINKPTMISSFLPSTKMRYMMKQLLKLAETHPDDKVQPSTILLSIC